MRLALLCALAVACVSGGMPSTGWANGRYPSAGQLVVDPADPRHIAVRATFGLLQSSDAGATWSWICEGAVSADGFQDPEIIVTTGGRLDVGLPDGVAVGDRSGCQWSRVPALANDDVIDLVQDSAAPAAAYAVAAVTVNGAFNGLVAGTTDGVSWTTVGALLPDTYPLTIEMSPSRPQRLYLGAEDGNLETGFIDVSDDGGASWTMHDGPAGVDSVYLSAVDPQDPDRVYVRSYFPQGSLYVSEDAANTWSLIDEADVPLTGFALSPDGQQIAVGGTNGLTILTRTAGDGGSAFAVTTTNPLPVSCLDLDGERPIRVCGPGRVGLHDRRVDGRGPDVHAAAAPGRSEAGHVRRRCVRDVLRRAMVLDGGDPRCFVRHQLGRRIGPHQRWPARRLITQRRLRLQYGRQSASDRADFRPRVDRAVYAPSVGPELSVTTAARFEQ